MKEESKIAWRSLGLEFIVIVVGVLAALAVDDWRQERGDRALEKHLLTSLIANLEEDESDAKFQEEFVQLNLDAVNHLLAVVGHPLAPNTAKTDTNASEIDASLWMLRWKAELEVFDDTYSEMMATGSLKVIKDPALRKQISKYYNDSRRLIAIPERQIDPRPEFLTALASVGIVPGYADRIPNLIERLKSEPLIATHALRIRTNYLGGSEVADLREKRLSLVSAIDSEIRNSP